MSADGAGRVWFMRLAATNSSEIDRLSSSLHYPGFRLIGIFSKGIFDSTWLAERL